MGTGIGVEVVTPQQLSAGELAQWRAFVAADPAYASPFFHPEFTRVAGEIAPGARVAIFHERGEIVGFFPHQRRGRTVQPLGAPLNDYHGVIAAPGKAPALESLPDLLDAGSVAVNGWVGAADLGGARDCLQAHMPHGWAAYDAERRAEHAKYFKDKDRARRGLERDYGEVRVTLGLRNDWLLDRLLKLKSEQYRRTRLHDIFACGWTGELLRALMKHEGEGFGASIAVLEAGGETLATEFSLHAGPRYHFWLPAYEAKAARYSPGILLSLETMRLASEQGYATFDYGFEGEGYKKYACNRRETVREAVVLATGAALAGEGRLATSLRRRWATIDACETTLVGRARGIVMAASAAIARSTPAVAVVVAAI